MTIPTASGHRQRLQTAGSAVLLTGAVLLVASVLAVAAAAGAALGMAGQLLLARGASS